MTAEFLSVLLSPFASFCTVFQRCTTGVISKSMVVYHDKAAAGLIMLDMFCVARRKTFLAPGNNAGRRKERLKESQKRARGDDIRNSSFASDAGINLL